MRFKNLCLAIVIAIGSGYHAAFAENKKNPAPAATTLSVALHDIWVKKMNSVFDQWAQISKESKTAKEFWSKISGIDMNDPIFNDLAPGAIIPKIAKIQNGVEISIPKEKVHRFVTSSKFGILDWEPTGKTAVNLPVGPSKQILFLRFLELVSPTPAFAQTSFLGRLVQRIGASTMGPAERQVFGSAGEIDKGLDTLKVVGGSVAGFSAANAALGCFLGQRFSHKETDVENCQLGAEIAGSAGAALGATSAVAVTIGTAAATSPVGRALRFVGKAGLVSGIALAGYHGVAAIPDLTGSRQICTGDNSFRISHLSVSGEPTPAYRFGGDAVTFESPSGQIRVSNTDQSWIEYLRSDERYTALSENQIKILVAQIRKDLDSKVTNCKKNPNYTESYLLGPDQTAGVRPQQQPERPGQPQPQPAAGRN